MFQIGKLTMVLVMGVLCWIAATPVKACHPQAFALGFGANVGTVVQRQTIRQGFFGGLGFRNRQTIVTRQSFSAEPVQQFAFPMQQQLYVPAPQLYVAPQAFVLPQQQLYVTPQAQMFFFR